MSALLTLLARLVLGAVWLVAGVAKLRRKEARARSVTNFGLRPLWLSATVGAALPWIEIGLGLLLILGKWRVEAAYVSAVLLAVFGIAIAISLVRGNVFDCNCFGQMTKAPISWASVARNAGLCALAVGIGVSRSTYLSVDAWQRGIGQLPTDPPLSDLIPLLLLATSALFLWTLATSTWQVASAVARAEDGPALGMSERRILRRWLRLSEQDTAGNPEHSANHREET